MTALERYIVVDGVVVDTTGVVISECYGGFGLSDEALARIRELGTEIPEYGERYLARDNPHLVHVVREMGLAASGTFAELVVVDIPVGAKWHVHEYDGYETLHEEHRVWTSAGEGECS